MMCSSCDAEANSCEWCVSYASLCGARLQPKTSFDAAERPVLSLARVGGPAGLTSPAPPAVVQSLDDVNSEQISNRQREVTPPLWPSRFAPGPASAPSLRLAIRAPHRFGETWEVPWTTAHIRLPHRHQAPAPDPEGYGLTISARALGPSNEILPQPRGHRLARLGVAVAAAVVTMSSVAAAVLFLPDRRARVTDVTPGHPVVLHQAHSAASVALTPVPARFVVKATRP
jgi:hypothetical protein